MDKVDVGVTSQDEILSGMRAWLADTLGDAVDMMLPELAEIFVEDSPPLLDKIHAALTSGDQMTLKDAAHTLKGSCASMGIVNLAAHCQLVETAAKENNMLAASAAMPRLETEFNQVMRVMNELN